MPDKNSINPELLQPEDPPIKPKRVRKPKVTKKEEPAVEAKEETAEPKWKYTYTYNHPEYDIYMSYQKYFEQQQKAVLEYCTMIMRNIWNPWK